MYLRNLLAKVRILSSSHNPPSFGAYTNNLADEFKTVVFEELNLKWICCSKEKAIEL